MFRDATPGETIRSALIYCYAFRVSQLSRAIDQCRSDRFAE